jgi:thioesterase domain-containing protein
VAIHLGDAGSFVSLFLRQGPYFVGEWCQEGLLAYEVARQIQERGCETRLLVMVDVPSPGSEKLSRVGKLVRRLQLEAFHLSVISGLPPREWQEYLAGRLEWFVDDWKLRRWKGAYHGGKTQKRPPQSFAEVLELSADNYKPLPYSGSVLFLQPQRRPAGSSWNTAAGWKDLIAGLEVIEVPGDHTTMLLSADVFTGYICRAMSIS